MLSVGIGAGAAAAALAIGDAPAARDSAPKPPASLKAGPTLTPAQNQQPLSAQTKSELAAWGTRLAHCLATEGATLGQPRTERSAIVIRVRLIPRLTEDPPTFLTQLNRCDQTLGAPPRRTTVTIERGAIQRGRGAIRLYKPRTCPLSSSPENAPQ